MSEAKPIAARPWPHVRAKWVWLAIVGIAIAVAAAYRESWWPELREQVAAALAAQRQSDSASEEEAGESHSAHDHGHAGHDEGNSLELSPQARKNIGLTVNEVVLSDYERTLSIPGIVVQQPGKSQIDVAAFITGVVTEVFVTQGQAVAPGQKLFDLRLTHEDVVQAQSDLLRTAEELDVIRREVKRLKSATEGGIVARKILLEREYEQQKQEAVFRAQREALRLHGLSDEQIDGIVSTGRLLPSLTVSAPEASSGPEGQPVVMQLQELKVNRGQHVATGDPLAILANHSSLLIEGRAFEQDAQAVSSALERGWKVSAILESQGGKPVEVKDLNLLYVSNQVDPESRALHFYVNLPNTPLQDQAVDEQRYLVWRFKPGQRMQIRIPLEKWERQIVLPIDAIAQDGVETFVFRENGDHFDRQPVHVVFRDQLNAVIANDGSVFAGDRLAMNGANQLLVALKNKSGGGADPHAGHNH